MKDKLSERELDYVLEEYKILWDYYKKTLDQRTEWIKSFALFIGVISTVLAILPNFIYVNNAIIVVLLMAASLIGLSISFVYMSESNTSKRYLKKIAEIREVLVLNTNIPKHLFDSNDTYNSSKAISISTKLLKCFPLCLINSLTFYFALSYAGVNLLINIIAASFLLVLQIVIYVAWLRK